VEAGELAQNTDCDELAAFIVSSQQGANLLAKTEHSPEPLKRLKQILFSVILRRTLN
jgi:TetR/AcrR family transcriptional regulator, transcriptional repressor for nem operon